MEGHGQRPIVRVLEGGDEDLREMEAAAMGRAAEALEREAVMLPVHSEIRALFLRSANRYVAAIGQESRLRLRQAR